MVQQNLPVPTPTQPIQSVAELREQQLERIEDAALAASFMEHAWNDSSESLPQPTARMMDCVDTWFIVTDLWGPRDLGNGPVFALELVDSDGVTVILYCGSRQIVGKLQELPIKAYVSRAFNEMAIRFALHPRGDKPYYTANVWFGRAGEGPVRMQ